jgi:hypothetical protein
VNALRTLGVIVLSVALLTAAVQVQAARERAFPPVVVADESLLVTSGNALRRLTVSFNPLAADVYWIRAIQYYGGAKRRLTDNPLKPAPPPMIADTSDYDQLYVLLDLTTTLDPRFGIAYRFGSVFLAEAYPTGAGRPDLAAKLLEKGLRERPDKWEYMEDIGFVHYWFEQDYRQAAVWFDKAGNVPGAPNWLKPLAATTLAQGGDRRSSRLMWQSMLQSAQEDWLREAAEHRLRQLRALDEIDFIQGRVDALGQQTGKPPATWGAAVRAGLFPNIPIDPEGTPYLLTPDGKVLLSPTSSLNPLPTESARAVVPS